MSFELFGAGQKDPPDPCGGNGYTWINQNKNNNTKTGCECASEHAGSRFRTKELCDLNCKYKPILPGACRHNFRHNLENSLENKIK